jgi:hypothetical protein
MFLLTADFTNELHLYLSYGKEQRDSMPATINTILEKAPDQVMPTNDDIAERLCYVMGFALKSGLMATAFLRISSPIWSKTRRFRIYSKKI